MFFTESVQAQPSAAETAATANATGVEAYNAGQWVDAIKNFEQAYNIVPDNQTVRRNLCNARQAYANVLAQNEQLNAAIKQLENAIGADPQNPSPLVQLAFYYLNPKINAVKDAIFRLEEAIDLDSENVDAHELLGEAYYKNNDLASARAQWDWVESTHPGRPGLKEKLQKATREENVEYDFKDSGSRHFKLSYPPGTSTQDLRKALSVLEKAYMQIGLKIGRSYPPTPIQVIVYNAKGFSDATQLGDHVGGLYDGKIRIPLTDDSGTPLDDTELSRRLYHEYTHVVVRFLGGDKVPWWLNEGLAEFFSRDKDSAVIELVAQANTNGKLFSLSSLEEGQLDKMDPQSLRIAYAFSQITVDYMWTHFGQQRFLKFLNSLTTGLAAKDALRQNFARTYETLEKEVIHSINKSMK